MFKALRKIITVVIFISISLLLILGAKGFWFNNQTFISELYLIIFIIGLVYVQRCLKFGWDKNFLPEILTMMACYAMLGVQSELYIKPHLEEHGKTIKGTIEEITIFRKGNFEAQSSFVIDGKQYKTSGSFSKVRKMKWGDTVVIKYSPIHPRISRIQ